MRGWGLTIVVCAVLATGCDGRSLAGIERSVAAAEADRRETKLSEDLRAAQAAVDAGDGDADPEFQPLRWTTGAAARAQWGGTDRLKRWLDQGDPEP